MYSLGTCTSTTFIDIYINIMAVNEDSEIQASTDEQTQTEQTPLLGDARSDEQPEQKEKEPRKASWYIWRVFWAIIVALVLALFIKGWIDAGSDVNVGSSICLRSRDPLTMICSSTWVRR